MKRLPRHCAHLCLLVVLTACAQNFPKPDQIDSVAKEQGQDWFNKTFTAHGGKNISKLNDVAVSMDGEWKFLITRIQPLVTDHKYRVQSEERILLKTKTYAAKYQGPGGTKTVFRNQSAGETVVHYNKEASTARDVLSSTALTADSFYLFTLGPLALSDYQEKFVYNPECSTSVDACIYLNKSPGLGLSERDEIVLWVDRKSHRTKRVAITLEGHSSTRGAHVDVRYDAYVQRDAFVFPAVFFERVLAPIKIDAHRWRLTGIDINRGLGTLDLKTSAKHSSWSDKAMAPATPLTASGLIQ